jgi:MFS superfamily sulfate permease-like transporter
MTDITFLTNFIDPIILGICLLIGFALKHAFEKFPNKYIPLFALSLGTLLCVIINFKSGVTAEIILGGMISGLASTGLYELLRNMIGKED